MLSHKPAALAYWTQVGAKNGLLPVLVLCNILIVIAHILAPGARLPTPHLADAHARPLKPVRRVSAANTAFKKTDDFTLVVQCINYILLVGESGVEKSPARRLAPIQRSCNAVPTALPTGMCTGTESGTQGARHRRGDAVG